MNATFFGAVHIREKRLFQYDAYLDMTVRQYDDDRRAAANVLDPVLNKGNKMN